MRGMAVAAHNQLARNAKARYLNRMADAIARSGNMYAITFCNRLQVNVVIRSFVIQI